MEYLKQVIHLTKEERIETLIKDFTNKNVQFASFTNTPVIDGGDLFSILSIIEDRIYFISESPNFEYKGQMITTLSMRFVDILDFQHLMDNHQKDFLIIYNILLNPDSSYMIRCNFMEDPSIRREQIIDQILE